ncbi:transcription factor GTE9 isoform X2 [Lactuca sativa]|uniref:transcription factor GTE9 isoform X2 n=1 Tax=Lactuca sativa TaxID=4236 RepID=UPI000CABAC48|nr:transcription factor GTE9 isoform X2 [Lactuca sativa]
MAPTFPVEFAGQRVSKKLSSQNNFTQMGKTRKVSKGYSHGFVPNYRHAVDTMANSEGFGSSGRLDTEMTASEDSCAPNRKSLNLNPDSSQHFGVPIQVLSLSKLSSVERKELGLRLKHELEQVRTLQKNIGMVSANSNVGVLSPSDVHSCSAGQRRPIPEYSRSMSLPMPKRKGPPGRSGGSRSKKSGSARVESTKKALPPTSGTGNAMLMKQCEALLTRLMGHNFGWVFNTPVDVVALKIPDYYTVIQHPMDLGTVKTKLMSGRYMDPWAFAGDVRLTFSNAMTYNPRGNDVHIMAETLSKYFEVRWKPIEKKLSVATEAVVPMRQNVVEPETETPVSMPPYKKKKTTSFGNETKQEAVKRTMSDAEKRKLSIELESSISDLPERIIDFLKESSSHGNATVEDEIEIDIDTLSDDTLFKLRKLLDDHFLEKQKNMVKAETCEIELHNESGFSNSSMQACKANEGNEEDVDIGGDEIPISSFPPVEIERDTAVRNSKSSSSSSSSSGSGSASSESDSGSSSGSESDDAKAPTIVNNAKDTMTMGSEVNNTEQIPVPDDAKDCVDGEQKCDAGESEGHQEGESDAPASAASEKEKERERQVSPDKLYRAALLRSRFADTILKAQEKTTGKVEEQDRERLRLEKEEVEKRRKQEKARLEAEAKAAEEAQRNAELEAKRKRELEREAARQAIQKMEKMVDINDNSGFLDDLEMLSVAPAQPLESLIDETSADCGLGLVDPSPLPLGLGGGGGGSGSAFNFDGKRNPLEQLGLYMKDDDEDEEEDDELAPPTQVDDPEEGEID